jgi:lipid II:glycine glycyltransferase (peptidoglycan interpeptide bridge formation enzyme)
MHAIILTEKDGQKYEKWLQESQYASIHQIWEWGVFQSMSAVRDKFMVIAVVDSSENILASALLVKQKLPFKKCWLNCPRGPVIDYQKGSETEKILATLFKKIEIVAKEENAVFLRVEPPISSDWPNPFKGLPMRSAHAHYQPESTLIVDLKHPPEELLKQMKSKGRYNIKVAQKHGVKIAVSDGGQKDIDAFYKLFSETTERDKFSGHPKKYYSDMLRILGEKKAKLYIAEYEGKSVAAAIITYFKDTATYYFGSSSGEHRNVMAPYLLHWQAILDAQNSDYHYYDFFGISPEGSQNHPWAKVTEFKLKFGGDRINYFPAQEIVYRPLWYWLVRAAKKIIGRMR